MSVYLQEFRKSIKDLIKRHPWVMTLISALVGAWAGPETTLKLAKLYNLLAQFLAGM